MMLQIAVRMGIRVGCLAASLACASGVCQKRNVKTKQQESPWVAFNLDAVAAPGPEMMIFPNLRGGRTPGGIYVR